MDATGASQAERLRNLGHMMRLLSIAFAVCALVTGLFAAWLWLRASKVEIATGLPVWRPSDNIRAGINLPGSRPLEGDIQDAIARMNEDLMATMYSLHQSSFLNKRAAMWTAVSVATSGLAAVLGSFGY